MMAQMQNKPNRVPYLVHHTMEDLSHAMKSSLSHLRPLTSLNRANVPAAPIILSVASYLFLAKSGGAVPNRPIGGVGTTETAHVTNAKSTNVITSVTISARSHLRMTQAIICCVEDVIKMQIEANPSRSGELVSELEQTRCGDLLNAKMAPARAKAESQYQLSV